MRQSNIYVGFTSFGSQKIIEGERLNYTLGCDADAIAEQMYSKCYFSPEKLISYVLQSYLLDKWISLFFSFSGCRLLRNASLSV